MFENYKLGVTIGPVDGNDTPTETSDKFLVKDDNGNLIGLQWSPVNRFTLRLTPDIICNDNEDIIRISIYNFRGESIFDSEMINPSATIAVDDSLSKILVQGSYYIDVIKCDSNGDTFLLNRLSLSIGYE